jgi:hypothetical protein
MMSDNRRYCYIGVSDNLYNVRGSSLNGDNPYFTTEQLWDALNNVTVFPQEYFLNNVELPSQLNISVDDIALYEPDGDTWILMDNDSYHIFV